MTVGDRSDADAEYQGLELGLRHADLADIIARTARWARAFDVRTPYALTDESTSISHPLKPYAVALEAIHGRLARAVAELEPQTSQALPGALGCSSSSGV